MSKKGLGITTNEGSSGPDIKKTLGLGRGFGFIYLDEAFFPYFSE
jgi:hypothetical protein